MSESKKPELTVRRVKAAMKATAGMRTAAARRLGVGRSTLYRFLDKHPQLIEFANDVDEEVMDFAESMIHKLLRSGHPKTVRWYMELKGKDRGYTRWAEAPPVQPPRAVCPWELSVEELELYLQIARRREQEAAAARK